jgi:hypothetical protein
VEVLTKSSSIQRKQKNDLLKGKAERNVALLVLLGEVLYDAVS